MRIKCDLETDRSKMIIEVKYDELINVTEENVDEVKNQNKNADDL